MNILRHNGGELKIVPLSLHKRELGKSINENYGHELDALQKALDKAIANMRGSSAADPKQIWIDLGVRNQFCDEEGKLL